MHATLTISAHVVNIRKSHYDALSAQLVRAAELLPNLYVRIRQGFMRLRIQNISIYQFKSKLYFHGPVKLYLF